MKWIPPKLGERIWEYRDDEGKLVGTLEIDHARGAYVDQHGQIVSNNFNKARENVEKNHKGEKELPKKGEQMGLQL